MIVRQNGFQDCILANAFLFLLSADCFSDKQVYLQILYSESVHDVTALDVIQNIMQK